MFPTMLHWTVDNRFAACSIFFTRESNDLSPFRVIPFDEARSRARVVPTRLPGMETATVDTLSRYGQRENCKNEGTRLRHDAAGHRFPTTIWLPNKFCPPVREHEARSDSAVQKSYRGNVPGLARPIDYTLIDYVTRDFVVGGINRGS